MKNLILHCGIPKTGSSVLQVFWAKNSTRLRERRVDYFQVGDFELALSGKITSGNGAFLARTMLKAEDPNYLDQLPRALAQLEAKINENGCDVGLLSSELFTFASDDALKFFRDWLAQRGICLQIFYFIRRQDQFVSSAYVQQVKRHGCTEMPDDYIRKNYKNFSFLNYYSLFQRFLLIAGSGNVICKSYDAAISSPNGLFMVAQSILGLSLDGFELVGGDVNTSLGASEIVMMLMLNKLGPRGVFSDYLVENSIKRGDSASGTQHSLVSSKTIAEVESFFEDENRKLAKFAFNRDALFERSKEQPRSSALSGGMLSFEDVVNSLGGLLVRFDKRLAEIEHKLSKL